MAFDDLGTTEADESFCDGLSEEILNSLSNIDGLRVAARTSSFSFKGKGMDVPTIGDALGVDAIREGSVRMVRGANASNKCTPDQRQRWTATLVRSIQS